MGGGGSRRLTERGLKRILTHLSRFAPALPKESLSIPSLRYEHSAVGKLAVSLPCAKGGGTRQRDGGIVLPHDAIGICVRAALKASFSPTARWSGVVFALHKQR